MFAINKICVYCGCSCFYFSTLLFIFMCFSGGTSGKEPTWGSMQETEAGLVPELGRSS